MESLSLNIASMIDHTILKAGAQKSEIEQLCAEARAYSFASVCVNPTWVPLASKLLKDSPSAVCTVIGFPLGASAQEVKAYETEKAVLDGADEIDMVINIGQAKDKNWQYIENEIRAVVQAAEAGYANRTDKKIPHVIVKVILETCYLCDEEIVETCLCAQRAEAHFVKTSTGFGTPGKGSDGQPIPNGAVIHHIELMKQTVGSTMKVKASGGIRDRETAVKMIQAGADRLGTSSGIQIVTEDNPQ